MRLLVFQHHVDEHPGSLRALLARDGVERDTVQLDAGDPIPDLAGYDALWVMGGPMDIWDVAEHPWLVAEKAAIRSWVAELRKPFLGVCLGHQLLADALGGACGPQQPAEIGVFDVELTAAAREDALFAGLQPTQRCLQWHGVQVTRMPERAVLLAGSPGCPVQAMRVGDHAWSMQYHVEVETDTVDNWFAIPAYRDAADAVNGPGSVDAMRAAAAAAMPGFLRSAERLYGNFMRLAVPGPGPAGATP